MSALIDNALRAVVFELHERELLLLAEGGSLERLAEELVEARLAHEGLGHAGSFVSSVLLASEEVDELFATDQEIVRLFSELGR